MGCSWCYGYSCRQLWRHGVRSSVWDKRGQSSNFDGNIEIGRGSKHSRHQICMHLHKFRLTGTHPIKGLGVEAGSRLMFFVCIADVVGMTDFSLAPCLNSERVWRYKTHKELSESKSRCSSKSSAVPCIIGCSFLFISTHAIMPQCWLGRAGPAGRNASQTPRTHSNGNLSSFSTRRVVSLKIPHSVYLILNFNAL